MITCQEFIAHVSDFIDGEVDAHWRREVLEHFRQCQPCHVVLDTTRETIRIFGRCDTYEIPAGVSQRLHAAIESKLRGAEAPPVVVLPSRTPWRERLNRLLRPARLVLVSGGLAAALVVGFFAASGTTVYGWLIDAHCAHYFRGSAAAEHPVGCNLGEGCRDVGWGVMTSSGEYLKFDPSGDQTALKILQTTSATKDLEIRVTGRKRGTEFVVRRMAVVNGGEARTAEFSQVLLFASH